MAPEIPFVRLRTLLFGRTQNMNDKIQHGIIEFVRVIRVSIILLRRHGNWCVYFHAHVTTKMIRNNGTSMMALNKKNKIHNIFFTILPSLSIEIYAGYWGWKLDQIPLFYLYHLLFPAIVTNESAHWSSFPLLLLLWLGLRAIILLSNSYVVSWIVYQCEVQTNIHHHESYYLCYYSVDKLVRVANGHLH